MAPLTLHIGAHRTATTSLQLTLRQMAEAGTLGELDYFGPHRLRPRFSVTMLGLSKAPLLTRLAPLRLLSPELARALSRDAPVLVSEEANLGRVDASLLDGRGLYPTAAAHMQALHAILGGQAARVVLSVRSPADWYPSAYAMAALRRKLPPMDDLAQRWLSADREWRPVAEAARAVFGTCEIFQYETLDHEPRALLTSLTGGVVTNAEEGEEPPRVNQAHSAATISAVQAARASGRSVGKNAAQALSRAEDGPAPRLRLRDDIAAKFDARYRREMAEMRADGFSFIGSDPFSAEARGL